MYYNVIPLIAGVCAALGVMLTPMASWAGDNPALKADTATITDVKNRIKDSDATVTLVHVWATWCPPCRKEFPSIVKLARTYQGDNLAMILISADKPSARKRVLSFLNEHNSPVGSFIAKNPQNIAENLLPSDWGGGIPASFFYNKDGDLEKWWAGAHSFAAYKKTVDKLTGAK